VVLTNLPAKGQWTLKRFPDSYSFVGVGTSVVITDLDPHWSAAHSKKCYSTVFTWLVVNECGYASPLSLPVEINTYQP
jgi:hypothetical protein